MKQLQSSSLSAAAFISVGISVLGFTMSFGCIVVVVAVVKLLPNVGPKFGHNR